MRVGAADVPVRRLVRSQCVYVAFTESLCRSPSFRAKFGGLYASMTNALARLGAKELSVPSFIQDKIAKARAALADEERLLDIMRKEADAREARVGVRRRTRIGRI